MKLRVSAALDYQFERPTDVLLQLEAAMIDEQFVDAAHIDVVPGTDFARVAAHDGIGDRIWVRAHGRLTVRYDATVTINRLLDDCLQLPRVEPRNLPGETIQYMMGSRYCPSDTFQTFVESEFAGLDGGQRIIAMRDWIADRFTYRPGVSNSETTSLETFVRRQGICRDYAHVLITLARASVSACSNRRAHSASRQNVPSMRSPRMSIPLLLTVGPLLIATLFAVTLFSETSSLGESVVHLAQGVYDEVDRRLERFLDRVRTNQSLFRLGPIDRAIGEFRLIDDHQQIIVGFVLVG